MQAFMVIVWIAIEVLFFLLFFSLPSVVDLPANETSPLVTQRKPSMQQHTVSSSCQTEVKVIPLSLSRKVWNLVREEIIVLLAVLFVVLFNQTTVEVGHVYTYIILYYPTLYYPTLIRQCVYPWLNIYCTGVRQILVGFIVRLV